MAMPAMAAGYEDEGVMPMYEAQLCPKCGKEAEYNVKKRPGRIWVTCLNEVCGFKGWLDEA